MLPPSVSASLLVCVAARKRRSQPPRHQDKPHCGASFLQQHGRCSPEVSAQQRLSERPAANLHWFYNRKPLVQARQIWLRDCTGADLLGKAAEGVAGSMISNRLLHVSARLPWHAGEGDQQSFPRGHPGAGVSRHSRLIMVRCSPAVSKLGELEYCRPCSTTRA